MIGWKPEGSQDAGYERDCSLAEHITGGSPGLGDALRSGSGARQGPDHVLTRPAPQRILEVRTAEFAGRAEESFY